VAVVVVNRQQLEQLRQLLDALPQQQQADGVAADAEASIPWPTRKAHHEFEAIQEALRRTGGNITRAATLLHMHRTTLWRKLKRYREEK